MRVLAVTYANRIPNNDRLYESLARFVDLERLEIDKRQALHLKDTLADHDLLDYDRLLMEVRAKHAMSQWRDLWKLPNLVLYEEDTWQNYARFSKNFGYFTKYYEKSQPCRIIHSGFEVANKTRELGFDSRFLPKGYDAGKLRNISLPRDVELGFIGRLEHENYVHRKKLLFDLAKLEPLQILRTSSDEQYLHTLNRIRYFISADVGFGEHMIKNFEALACGCVLFACRQGKDDIELGLQDMVNVVFYNSIGELRDKLNRLRQDEALTKTIASNGQKLAEAGHDHWVLGARLNELLSSPLQMAPQQTLRRGGKLATKEMSNSFFNRHWDEQALIDGDNVLSLAEQGLTFRFFALSRPRWMGRSAEQRRFIINAYNDHQAGIPAPNIRYWGIQKDRHLAWVAYDSFANPSAISQTK